MRFAAGLGLIGEMEEYFQGGKLIDPEHAGRLGDPYEDRFRCERTAQNFLDQALFFACKNAQLECARFLIEKGADVNSLVPGLDGALTILHRLATPSDEKHREAEETRRLPVIKLLMDARARVDIREATYNSTAIGWAEHFGRRQMADLLRSGA